MYGGKKSGFQKTYAAIEHFLAVLVFALNEDTKENGVLRVSWEEMRAHWVGAYSPSERMQILVEARRCIAVDFWEKKSKSLYLKDIEVSLALASFAV